jgi:succinoglycan biosynthesis transport protein ExoP
VERPTTHGLRDYLSIVRRRKWIFIFGVVAVPAAAVVFSMRQPNVYQASAQVLLNRENLTQAVAGLGPDPMLYQQPQRITATQADLARVPQVAANTLAALKLKDRTPSALLKNSSVKATQDLDVLTFKVMDHNKALAPKLATEYARQYTLYRRQLDTLALHGALTNVNAKLEQLVKKGDRTSALYTSLVDKQQLLSTLESLQTQNAVLVRPAVSAPKIKPTPVRNGVLGLALGLALGIGLVFLAEALDTRVRTAEGIAERLGIPLIGRLPAPPKRLSKGDKLVMLSEPNSFQAEPFRILRTNFEFANLDRGARTIMVTSAVQGEGKSTTVANLALALARAGKRVTVVDLDLRRPYMDKFFNSNGTAGLTEVALGHADLEDAIFPVVLPEHGSNGSAEKTEKAKTNGSMATAGILEVVSSGPLPPDPGEFVGSSAVDTILRQLSDRTDIVLVDSPPLLSLSDGFTLSEKVDAVIVVCRLNTIRRPMLTELKRLLDATPAEKLGFIVAEAQAEQEYGYGYGYGYRYGYGYGYGYGRDRETQRATETEEVS